MNISKTGCKLLNLPGISELSRIDLLPKMLSFNKYKDVEIIKESIVINIKLMVFLCMILPNRNTKTRVKKIKRFKYKRSR